MEKNKHFNSYLGFSISLLFIFSVVTPMAIRYNVEITENDELLE